jgi:D-3-phosphoglycerate dehydrogenase
VTQASTVIALGHTWPDLSIEEETLRPARVVDGRNLASDDPLWAEASAVLLGTAARLDGGRIGAMPSCRAIVRYGIGHDNVDLASAEAHGIAVAIVRDYCIDEVAEHALAFALSLARALPHWDRNVRAGAWRAGPRPPMRRLSALSIGILGFGLIGRSLARKAGGLFGRVLVHDPVAQLTEEDRRAGYFFVDSLADLLGEVDILSVHVPLLDTTRGLIGAAALARMKPTAGVINVSRGGIVDERALLDAVRTGRIAGAALDTFEKEPLAADDPLLAESRILLSPHVAWLSEEAEINLRRSAARDAARALAGELPAFPVTTGNGRLKG